MPQFEDEMTEDEALELVNRPIEVLGEYPEEVMHAMCRLGLLEAKMIDGEYRYKMTAEGRMISDRVKGSQEN